MRGGKQKADHIPSNDEAYVHTSSDDPDYEVIVVGMNPGDDPIVLSPNQRDFLDSMHKMGVTKVLTRDLKRIK